MLVVMGLLDRWLGRFLGADDSGEGDPVDGQPSGLPLVPVFAEPTDPADLALKKAREKLTLDAAGRRYAEGHALQAEVSGLDAAGRSRAADALLADALLVSPSLALRRTLAERLLHRGDRKEASALLEQLASSVEHAAWALTSLGELAELEGDEEQALSRYERVLAIDMTAQQAKARARRLRRGRDRAGSRAAEQRALLVRFLGARAAGARYAVLEEIGRGGAATVFRARDRVVDREVALKIFHPRGRTAERRERIVQEARIAGAWDHPHIVPILDIDEGRDLLVMALCEGGSLRQRLSEEGRLRTTDAAELGAVLLRTLADIHGAGGVHLDVKPSNLLFSGGRMMLCDFGTAGLTQMGAGAGTRAYMSPEQRARGDASPASDLYAAGLVVYECIAGRLPEVQRKGGSLVELEALPAGPRRRALEGLVSALTAEDPNERPSDARKAAEELLEAAALPVSEAEGVQLWERLTKIAAREGASEQLLTHPIARVLQGGG
jgi:tRNA A-37 threonylcarbamoyl transferase component Bud32